MLQFLIHLMRHNEFMLKVRHRDRMLLILCGFHRLLQRCMHDADEVSCRVRPSSPTRTGRDPVPDERQWKNDDMEIPLVTEKQMQETTEARKKLREDREEARNAGEGRSVKPRLSCLQEFDNDMGKIETTSGICERAKQARLTGGFSSIKLVLQAKSTSDGSEC